VQDRGEKVETRLARIFLSLAAVLLAGACASTSLVNQWKSPDFSGPPLRKVLVVGVSTQPSLRRVFEDEFAASLRTAGVQAVQSYTVITQDGQADQAVLEKAVRGLEADAVLVTRLVRREQQTWATPGYYRAPAMGFYGWYSAAWIGYYEPPNVYTYDVVTVDTSLYSPPRSKLLWSGITETFAPTDVKKSTAEYAKVIIGALRQDGFLGVAAE
jgi:hypothetical protein